MATTAEVGLRRMLRQVVEDLKPAPLRFAMTWRIALLCALVIGAAMAMRVEEAAISCYLIIFLAKPDAAESSLTCFGLLVLATLVVAAMIPIINVTSESAFLQFVVVFFFSYLFLFLGSATSLGEQAQIVGLIIAFILTLLGSVPVGEISNQVLIYAWQMAALPMVMAIMFYPVLGFAPHDLLRDAIAERLRVAAAALRPGGRRRALTELIGEGNALSAKRVMSVTLLRLVPTARARWLGGATDTSFRLLLAIAALPRETTHAPARAAMAERLERMADEIAAGRIPTAPGTPDPQAADAPHGPAWQALSEAADGICRADGGAVFSAPKTPFLAADAFTNPEHQHFAIKTAFAAILAYVIYTGMGWSGIHTALVTCFVASLTTTGETVHKLLLRITGALIGAAIGIASMIWIIPHLNTAGGLMVIVFLVILLSAWVSTGPERISYAGVQIGLAFLLVVITGFSPSTDLSGGGDRIAGILLGNVLMWLMFTQVWPRPVTRGARVSIGVALSALSRYAAAPAGARPSGLLSEACTALESASSALGNVPFETRDLRPPPGVLTGLLRLIAETRAFAADASVTQADLSGFAPRLAAVADGVSSRIARAPVDVPAAGATARPAPETFPDSAEILGARMTAIEQMGRI